MSPFKDVRTRTTHYIAATAVQSFVADMSQNVAAVVKAGASGPQDVRPNAFK